MAEALAALALRITAEDQASGVLQHFAQELQKSTSAAAAGEQTAAAASTNAAAAHEVHKTALGKLGAAFKSVGQEALRLATFQTIWNLEGGLANQVARAAEMFDKFGSSVAGVQRLTGETAENSSLLLGTLTRYGLTTEQASTALVKLARSMAGTEDAADLVASSGKTGAAQLEALGISSQDAAGRMKTQLDVMLELSDAIKNKSAQEQVSIIATVFKVRGNEAAALQRVLNQGSAAIQDYFNVLKTTGNTFDQKQVDDVLRLGEAHRRLDLAFSGVAIQVGSAFAPAITTAANVIAHLGTAFAQTVVPALQQIPGLLPVIATGLGVLLVGAAVTATASMVKFAVTGLGSVIQASVKVGGALAALVVRYAATAAAAAVAAAAQVAAWLVAAGPIVLIIAGIVAAAGAIALALSGKLGEAKDAIAAGIQKIGQAVKDGWAAIQKLGDPFDTGVKAGEDYTNGVEEGVSTTAAEKIAKKAKEAADNQLKQIQDAQAQRKEQFDLDHQGQHVDTLKAKLAADEAEQNTKLVGLKRDLAALDNTSVDFALKRLQLAESERKAEFDLSQIASQTQAMKLKLASDEADHNATLLGYKRQLEDVDRNSIDFALKRQQLDEQDAVTVAKMSEDKLRAQADDLSYQERLLIAQARATKMAGGNVDTGALRDQIMAIRTAQIANEPALLTAEHDTALANRAKQGTDAQAGLENTALERQKLAIQEAMNPWQETALQAKRAAEDAQTGLELERQRFEIAQQANNADQLKLQIQQNAIEQQKLALQEAIKPWEELATQAKNAAEDAQKAYDLEKARFDIIEAEQASDLIKAQQAARAADEAYRKAQADAETAKHPTQASPQIPDWQTKDHPTHEGAGGSPWTPTAPPTAPLIAPAGLTAGTGTGTNTVNITNNNSVRSDADVQSIIDKTIDLVISTFLSATKQTTNKPAYHGLPGAYATSTP